MPVPTFVLSAAEFAVLREHLGLGAAPAALRLPPAGRTRAERVRIVAHGPGGLDGLRGRGLAGPAGADPVLVRQLVLLHRPERQLEVRGWFGAPLRAVAAERDGDGVLAVHTGGTVTVRPAGAPAHAAVSALPPVAAGPLLRVPATAPALPGDRAAPVGPLGVPVTAPAGRGDADVVAAVLRGPTHRARVCAVRYDRWGSPARLPGHVAVVDTPDGRYLLTGGPGRASLAPADRDTLAGLLTDLLRPGRSAASADDPPR
ncbi:ESX secretion-associated protein EspG [Pseudonocardia sp. C8]|uniref:ESX secretion-associated protein EspG n=1 Tax=Pseudonocardia sp. C8 TaxID=2762759 RepID=UPI001642E871|nr:ESX secretion-associated protein EspG [Pseudonocardia sp. C8]